MLVRVLCYFLNLGGFYMLCSPLLKRMSVLPLAAYFLNHAFYVSGLCTAAVLTLAAQLLFTSFAWVAYRPLLATVLFLLSLSVGAAFMLPGEGMSYHEASELYSSKDWA